MSLAPLPSRGGGAASALLLLWTAAAGAADYYLAEPDAPKVPDATFPLTDYGGVGDGKTLCTDAFRQAIEACAKAGGGSVVVPAGTYLSGPITLASRTALVLEKGAVLQASDRFSDFGLPDPLPATQAELDALERRTRPLLSGADLTDVVIRGAGTIDGAGAVWWAKSDKAAEKARPGARPLYLYRPNLIVLRKCERVRVQGVTLTNSPMFHLVPHLCREVLVEDVTIMSPADSPNTDGIDPANCRDVLIRRCTIDTGDDDVALKAGGVGGVPTENVTVADCTFRHGHGVSIGSETQAGVRNFLVRDCRFENTGTALRIKSDRTRGGAIENVTYRDIKMKNVEEAIVVFLYYDDKKAALSPAVKPVTADTPMVHEIHFLNIACDGATRRAGEIIGLPESPATDVELDNVHVSRAAAGFVLQDVRGLRMKDVDVLTAPYP